MSEEKKSSWPFRFLNWFCPAHLYEEIEGDLIQKFENDVKVFSEQKAKRRLIWNAIRFFRPGIVLRNRFSIQLIQIYMLQNYFKVALRSLLKNKVFSLINLSGLAIGMAAFFLILHYVKFERSYENFHKNADNIYRITLEIYKGSEYVITDSEMYPPVGAMLTQQLPEVLDFVRLYEIGNQEVKIGANQFYEKRVYFADPSVFSVFSFAVLQGDPATALSSPFQTALTESMAKKYFGRTNVINESIEIGKNVYKISAVLKDVPANTHMKFDFLLSHSTIAKLWNYSDDDFSGNNEYTYLLMDSHTDLTQFNTKLALISKSLEDKIGDDRLLAEPIEDIHLYSSKSYEPEPNGNARSVYFLLIIAIFILFIAWINYVNLSTAKAVERAREVGIRKVMGSYRSGLIFQFLSESTMITLVASVLSIVLIYLSLPLFKSLTGQNLPLTIFYDSRFWYTLIGLTIFGSLLVGFYPAYVLSSFEPVLVLKGKFRFSAKGLLLRKGLVVFQFATTIILIVSMSTVYLQINHLQKQDLGMDIQQILVLRSASLERDSIYSIKSQAFKNQVQNLADVTMVALSGALPGLDMQELSTTGNVFRQGQDRINKGYIYTINDYDENIVPLLQLKFIAGKNFETASADRNEVIINETALETLGYLNAEEAVGSTLFLNDQEKTVIGVLKNFYQRSPKEKHIPMVLWYNNQSEYFSLRINTSSVSETLEAVKMTWHKVFSDSPFDYFFLDERYNQQYMADQQFGKVIGVFSTLAILIACLGLFGLSSFAIVQRTKEIGIRKVLGASLSQIVQLLSRDFVKLVLIAGLVAIPFGYIAMKEWLSNYATHIELSVWIFVIPSVVVLFISLFTVSFQTIRAAQSNPVDTLKDE